MDDKLLITYIKGEASQSETQFIVGWLDESEKNMRHFMTLRRLYDQSLWTGFKEPEIKSLHRGRKLMYELLKTAAIVAITFLIVRGAFMPKQRETETIQTVTAPFGQHAEIILSDGSKVWLNSGSSLYFPSKFSNGKREVRLEGEGFFEVRSDKKNPFIVSTKEFDIKATGTSFNVLAYSNTDTFFETSLLEGKVEVLNRNNHHSADLSSGERVSLIDGNLVVSDIRDKDHFLWRNGIISFDHESLPDVINKLKLYFDVDIVIENKVLDKKQYKYTGKFRIRDGLDHALNVLQVNRPFKYYKDDEYDIIRIKQIE